MSNSKDVRIVGEVPYDWLSAVSDSDAALVARWCCSPFGLRITYNGERYVPLEGGGRLALERISIFGSEAIPVVVLARLMAMIRSSYHGQLISANYTDLDDGYRFYDLTQEEAKA